MNCLSNLSIKILSLKRLDLSLLILRYLYFNVNLKQIEVGHCQHFKFPQCKSNGFRMKVVIIIPTYNEAGNIERLISEINTITRLIPHIVNLLVVDDNSPDGTGQHVRNLMERHPNVHLITGKKKGLGSAYIRGITHAINSVGADAIMEMDADFPHKPGDIGRLLAGLGEADFVIGSRYINGGKIPGKLGIYS